jgi:predicted HicB family RNase H-like nuclease
MSKDLHRRLALESATQGVSLNNWITTKLAR